MTRPAWGWAATAVAWAAWPAALALPWLAVLGDGDDLARADLAASGVAYERAIAAWPLAGLPVAAAATGLATWTSRAGARPWTPALGGVALLASFLALLAAVRMLGFALVRAMDPGPASLVPGAAATVTAAAGVAGVAWSLGALRSCGSPLPWPAAAAGATLLATPLLPFGASGDGTFLYDELSIAGTVASGDGVLERAGTALAWMRGALLATLVAGVALAGVRGWLPVPAGPATAALALPAVAALALAGVFLARWAAVEGLGISWNPVPPLGALAAVVSAWPARRAFRRQPDVAPRGEVH